MEEAREMLGKLYEEFGLNEVTLKASQLLDDLIIKEVCKREIPINAN